jgi:hypothetical protein
VQRFFRSFILGAVALDAILRPLPPPLAPFGRGDVSESRRDQHQSRVSIGESPDNSRPSSAQLPQVGGWVRIVGHRFTDLLFHQLSRLRLGSSAALLGVDRFEHACHFGYFPVRRVTEHVAIEMHDSALQSALGNTSVTARGD